jgi:hypothetical protein
VQPLFNPTNCFAKGGLQFDKDEKPVLAGNCQVVQFGKNNIGNDCMFVCQADFSKASQKERPVLASFVFDDMGRVIDLYFGNSAAAPSQRTVVKDGTRASFGILPPPPPPKLQRPDSLIRLVARLNLIDEIRKLHHKTMTEDEARKLYEEKHRLSEQQFKEEAQAKEEHARALVAYNKLLQIPRWGCTRVLKGPLIFVGSQLDARLAHLGSSVEGFSYVSCVQVHAEFDQRLEMSHDNEENVKPYFEYTPHTGSRYGSSSGEYFDGMGFVNQFGNLGHESFVVLQSDNSIKTVETRTGHAPNPRPVPPSLSVLNPETREKFELELIKGHRSLLSETRALKWLETHPLLFPKTGSIDSTFANKTFNWVHALSMQFETPVLSLSRDVMSKMLERRASPAVLVAPSIKQSLFHSLVPVTSRTQNITRCSCTQINHNPRCPNQFCQFRHAVRIMPEDLSFMWPTIQFESGDLNARSALNDAILAVSAKADAAKAKADAAKAKADAAKEAQAFETRVRSSRGMSAPHVPTVSRTAAAASAAAASVASAAVSAPKKPASTKPSTKPSTTSTKSVTKKKKGGSKTCKRRHRG